MSTDCCAGILTVMILINRENLLHNIEGIKAQLPADKKIVAVVKANAYGAGLQEVVPILEDVVDSFAVDDVDELHAIRFLTEKEVYVLGYVPRAALVRAVDLKGTLAVYDVETLRNIDLAGNIYEQPIPINIKIDAFLGRQGLLPDQLPKFLEVLKEKENVKLNSMYSHFANIEDTNDPSHAKKQMERFDQAIEIVRNAGFDNFSTHISSTAGALVYDAHNETEYTHVRIGLGLLGLWPSNSVREMYKDVLELKPVIKWCTYVAQVKRLPKGHTIGYGLTHTLSRDSVVAVIPQGYSDGYDRKLSGQGEVLIHGRRCPVLGRIAMNMFVVDVTEIDDVKAEDEVVLIGEQGDENITADEIADKIGTINYEVIARLNALLPRMTLMGEL